jgi:hypothetical protein
MEDTKFKEAVAGIMKDKNQREALAQIIIEYVQPNHISNDFMSLLLDTRALNPGDTLVKKVRRGVDVRTWVPGSMSLKSEFTVSDRINWVLDAAIVSLTANEWELESGDLGTVESMKSEALMKLKDYYFNKVFTAMSTIWSAGNTPSNYTDCGGVLTQSALENMIQAINNTTSGAKAIVGVRSSLIPITKFGPFWGDAPAATGNHFAWSDSILTEVLSTGWLGKYMGVPVIALNQVYNNLEDYTPLLPTDKVLVIGDKVGEFITYGPEKSKEWTDMRPTPPYWNLDIVQQFGMIIDNAMGIGVLKVTP